MAMLLGSKAIWVSWALASVGAVSGAVHGVVKDDAGKPVAGALVVAEGTDLSDITDAQGKFELSTVGVGRSPLLRTRLQEAKIQVDGLGRFQKNDGAFGRKLLLHKIGSPAASPEKQQNAVAARAAATDAVNLLVSGGGYFSGFAPVELSSTAENIVGIESIVTFAQKSSISQVKSDLNLLQLTDSIMEVLEPDSKENAVCKDGKPVILPDTSTNRYKIVGKTMYLWDTEITDESDYTATVLTSGSGEKFGVWSFNGISQPPIPLPDSIEMTQAGLDSMLAMQRATVRYSGTATVSANKIRNDVTYGICMAQVMAMGFSVPPMVGTAKNCNDLELTNGDDTATWSFEFTNNASKMTFTYQDSTCTFASFVPGLDPMYDCTGIEDGMAPEDTSGNLETNGASDLMSCPGFLKFMTGGIDIPIGGFPGDLPIDTTGLGIGLNKKAALPMSIDRFSKSLALERKWRKRLVKGLP
jgi:hypothetical protein